MADNEKEEKTNLITAKELNDVTGRMLVCLKGYNYKLCRKGLLERGMGIGKWFGSFKDLENKYLVSASIQNTNVDDLLSELKRQKAELVKKEINQLKLGIENLEKTIENRKREVRQRTDDYSYIKWSQFMNDSSLQFKILFSDEMNDMFNHLYKMDQKYENVLKKIASTSSNTKNDVDLQFMKSDLQREIAQNGQEDDLLNGFLNSSGRSDNDSHLKGTDDTQNGLRNKENDDSGFSDNPTTTSSPRSRSGQKSKQKSGTVKEGRKKSKIDYELVDEVGNVEMDSFKKLY